MRVAIADIGTNSCHMLIAQFRDDGGYDLLDRLKERTRLGEALVDGRLDEDGLARVEATLGRFRDLADRARVQDILVYGTSALREAGNGRDAVTRWRDATGIAVEVITGEREAELTYLGVARSLDLGERNVLLDLGGGSLEVALGGPERAERVWSFPLGAVRLTRAFLGDGRGPVGPRERRRIVAHVRQALGPALEAVSGRADEARFVGSSGTFENAAAMIDAAGGHGARSVNGFRLRLAELEKLARDVSAEPIERRLKRPGADPRRADILPAGLLTLGTALEAFGARSVTVSTGALREGILAEYLARRAGAGSLGPRAASVQELAERFNADARHARHVVELADALFGALASRWSLGEPERELLRAAAHLHEIGQAVNASAHHKHSAYLIQHGGLRGFEPADVELVALVARYHRKSPPKPSHPEYARLGPDRQALVRRLAAILRVADGLDRGHAGRVQRVGVRDRGGALTVEAAGPGNLDLELWGASAKADMLAAESGRAVKVVRASGA